VALNLQAVLHPNGLVLNSVHVQLCLFYIKMQNLKIKFALEQTYNCTLSLTSVIGGVGGQPHARTP